MFLQTQDNHILVQEYFYSIEVLLKQKDNWKQLCPDIVVLLAKDLNKAQRNLNSNK